VRPVSDDAGLVPTRGKRPRNRRDLIITAASELFSEDGYANVSMDDIARAVNVRPSALYRHFLGKQEILREAILRGARLRQSAVRLHEPVPLDDVLDDLARSALATRRSSLLWTMEVRNLDPESSRAIRKEFRALPETLAAKLGAARPELNAAQAEVLAWAALDVLASIAFHEERLPDRTFERVLRDAMKRVLTVALPEPSQEPPRGGALDRPARREALLAAGAELFARHGYHAVTLDDLGRSVGMAGASLYTYFSSKQQLLATLAVRSLEWQEHEIRQHLRDGQGPAERLAALVEAHVRFTFAEPALVTLLLTETQELPADVRESLERIQSEAVDEWAGLLRRVDPSREPTVARIQVHAARMVVRDVLTTHSLRAVDQVVPLVRRVARAVLEC
jgi:AcrR family transcriptional regulator